MIAPYREEILFKTSEISYASWSSSDFCAGKVSDQDSQVWFCC
jgi:hypothetical protein